MKKFIDSLQPRLSDLFLLTGTIGFVIFIAFGQDFMANPNIADAMCPLWALIVASVVMIASYSVYFYLEIVKNQTKINKYVAFAFIGIVLLNIVAILVQPASFNEDVIIRMNENAALVGTTQTVNLTITATHKFAFISEYLGLGAFLFICFFMLPKRIGSVKFIEFLGYGFILFTFVLVVYSYITEFDKYIGWFKYVLGIDRSKDLSNDLSVQSFMGHKNPFGMVCMLGILFALINQNIKQRWFYYPIVAYFFISMVFSLCKTGILLTAIIILVYFVYRLVVTYREHKLRNRIAFLVLVGLLFFGFIFVGLPYLIKGKIFGKIYELISSFTSGGYTLMTRGCIWDNTYQLLQNGWWLLGRGFGSINTFVSPMNEFSHYEIKVVSLHSSFLTVLSSGGILTFLAFILLLAYFVYVTVKSYKKAPELTVATSLAALTFFLYSFVETNHYLIYLFMFLIFIVYFKDEQEKTI